MTNPTTVYLMRHGETEWNIIHRIQGISDSPLTKKGIEETKALAQKLKAVKLDLIFSSDLLRAKRTAKIVALEKELEVQETKLLRERMYGEFEGKFSKDYEAVNKIMSKLSAEERYSYKHSPLIESDEEIVNRFITFIREVAIANPGKTVLMVSHGGIMRAAIVKMGFGDYNTMIPGSVGNNGWVKFLTDGVEFEYVESEGVKFINE